MTWFENIANLMITGAICTYAVYDFFRDTNAQQQRQGSEATSSRSTSRSQTTVSSQRWTTVQHTGPGWQSTVYTFGDSSPPGVLTLHNLLGHSAGSQNPLSFGHDGEGPSELLQLLQHLQQDLDSPQLQLAGAGSRDFTEADYELLSALDQGTTRRRAPVTAADVAALPTHVHCGSANGAKCAAEEEQELCSICLDDFVAQQEVKTLPCLHHFHTGCIEEWLRQQGRSVSCPVCKTPVFEGQRYPQSLRPFLRNPERSADG